MKFRIGLMMILLLSAGVMPLFSPPAAESPAGEEDGRKSVLTIRKMLASIRLKKYDRALGYIGLQEMTRYLLDRNYEKLTSEQSAKFQKLLGEYIRLRAFPLAIKYIGNLDVSYDKPQAKEGNIHVRSSVIYRGSERLIFTWVLTKRGDDYVITDFISVTGESSMEKNRDKQVLPIYRKRGATGLIKTLERAVNKLK